MDGNANQQTDTTKGKEGMDKFTKIAIVVGAIVILVVLAEAAYLLFNKNTGLLTRPTRQDQANQTVSRQFQAPATPSPIPNLQQSEKTIDYRETQAFIASLETLSSGNGTELIEEANASFTITGRVVSKDGQSTVVEGHPYRLVLRSQLGREVTIYYTEEEISNSRILAETQDQIREISFQLIGTGDIIEITKKWDLLDTSSAPGLIFKITR